MQRINSAAHVIRQWCQLLECNVRSHAVPKKKANPTSQRMKLRASNHAIECSKRGTLVDRGANGGVLGDDAKVVFHRKKTVDVTGIDNHELSSLHVVNAAAKTLTDKGEAILILRHCACH